MLAKVDATENGALASKFGVRGYPTMKIFRHGELSADYEGGRETAQIVAYMQKQAGPSSRELDSAGELQALLDGTDPVVVGFFKTSDSPLSKAFFQAADALRDNFRFAHSHSADVFAKAGHEDAVAVLRPKVLQSKFEDNEVVFDASGKIKVDALKSWISDSV